MSTPKRLAVVGGLCVAACAWIAVASSSAWDESEPPTKSEPSTKTEGRVKPGLKKTAMKAFMRKKLAASQDILEGLALEDFELIEKGAKELKATAAAAEFMVVNDPLYAEFADDFRRTVGKLEKAAREKRIDGATLSFVDTTMNCVECHKYVRTILVAQ